jgi:hypothetical protein
MTLELTAKRPELLRSYSEPEIREAQEASRTLGLTGNDPYRGHRSRLLRSRREWPRHCHTAECECCFEPKEVRT